MSVKIEFVGDSWDDVATQMRLALGASPVFEKGDSGAVEQRTETRPVADKKPATSKKDDPKPKDEPKADAPKDDKGATDEKDPYDYETVVKPAMLKVAEKGGRELVMEVLGRFNVANAGKVPPEDREALMEAINEALGE